MCVYSWVGLEYLLSIYALMTSSGYNLWLTCYSLSLQIEGWTQNAEPGLVDSVPFPFGEQFSHKIVLITPFDEWLFVL